MPYANKLDVTRPKFLLHLMGNSVDMLTESVMRAPLCDYNVLSYCAYTVLMEADLKENTLEKITADEDSIAVRFKSRSDVESIAKHLNKEKVRYGNKIYRVKAKARDRYIVLSIDEGTEIE